jgi:hypothetical protein
VNGEDIRPEPTEDRIRRLAGLLRLPHDGIALNEHFHGDGAVIFKHTSALGCEGIVSKRLGSPYRALGALAQDQKPGRAGGATARRRLGLDRAASPPPLVGRQNGSMH